MSHLAWLLVLALVGGACAQTGPAVPSGSGAIVRLSPELTVRSPAPRVYVVTHDRPYPANSVVVEARDGTLVLVGSPYTAEATRVVLAWLQRKFGARRRVAIDTHFHEDAGIGGNPVYREAGIPIYGSELTVGLLAERTPGAVPPDHVFPLERGLELDFGEPVKVAFPGPGHSRDNVVVHFPSERLLVGGCLVKAGDAIGNTADADLPRWASSVRGLASYDVDWIVPGHGERLDRGLIAHTIEVVSAALAK